MYKFLSIVFGILLGGCSAKHAPLGLKFEQATCSQREFLVDFAIQSNDIYHTRTAPLATAREVFALELAWFDAGAVELLMQGDEVVGFFSLKIDNEHTDVDCCELGHLFVKQGLQGCGYGTMLFQRALELAQAKGFKRLTWISDPDARDFYLKKGAKIIGTCENLLNPGVDLPIFEYSLKRDRITMERVITFKKADITHKHDIFEWLEKPHVTEFWDTTPEHKQDILIFMNGRHEKSPYFNGVFDYWVGCFDDEPFCLIMTSELSCEDDASEWKNFCSKTGKTFGLDFMIGNEKYLGKGLGAGTLTQYMQYFREHVEPQVATFMIDPAANNPKAKHVYEKAGFVTVSEFKRDYGTIKNMHHFLMIKHV